MRSQGEQIPELFAGDCIGPCTASICADDTLQALFGKLALVHLQCAGCVAFCAKPHDDDDDDDDDEVVKAQRMSGRASYRCGNCSALAAADWAVIPQSMAGGACS